MCLPQIPSGFSWEKGIGILFGLVDLSRGTLPKKVEKKEAIHWATPRVCLKCPEEKEKKKRKTGAAPVAAELWPSASSPRWAQSAKPGRRRGWRPRTSIAGSVSCWLR